MAVAFFALGLLALYLAFRNREFGSESAISDKEMESEKIETPLPAPLPKK